MSDSEYESPGASPQKHDESQAAEQETSTTQQPDYESAAKQEEPEQKHQEAAQQDEPDPYSEDEHYESPDSRRNESESPSADREREDQHQEQSQQQQSQQRGKNESPSATRSRKNTSHARSHKSGYPPIATVSYPARQENLQVTDFLDPSRPLVKSTLPLTKPVGPSFVEEDKIVDRIRRRQDHKQQKSAESSKINKQRANERRYLKAQYEFEREKKLAEKAIYHRERCSQWSMRLGASPLAVDLVADNERIEEEAYIRELEEKRRKAIAEKKKRKVKNQIIVKALAEVPLLEEARRQKREMLDEERREKALRDVQRVEVIQMRKQRDQQLMEKERQERLDQRIMSQAGQQPHSSTH